MGGDSSKQKFDRLDSMKKLEDRGNYQIWEEGDKQYDYSLFTSSDRDFKEEEKIVLEIKNQNFEGIVHIDTIQLSTTDKWYAKINCLHLLAEHPKYNLAQYIARKEPLGNQQIIDLVLHIAGAQMMLGAKAQYIGFNNIYTTDGKTFKLKPFEITQSFYPIYNENRKNLGISFEMSGFPAPEEFKTSVADFERVSIFGFGMIILQLIGSNYLIQIEQKSQEIYTKKGIDEQLLQQKINYLQNQKQNFSGIFIEIVIDMIDMDLTRRPNYQMLVKKLRSPASKISTINVPQFFNVSAIKGFQGQDSVDFFNPQSLMKTEEIKIIYAVSQIDDQIKHGLSTIKSQLLTSTTKKIITNLDGTTYEGELGDGKYQGAGQIKLKNGKLLFEGNFDKGNYEFGVYHFQNPQQLHTEFQWNDCTDIFKYALRYEGKFQNNKRHGEGKLILTNGEMYCGDFKNDLIDGHGAHFKMDKSHVCGQWIKGQMHSTPGFAKQFSSYPPPSQMQSFHPVPFEASQCQKPVSQPSDLVSFTQYKGSIMPKEQSEIALSKLSELKSQIQCSLEKQKMNLSKRQVQIEGNTLYYDYEKKVIKYQGDHQDGIMNGAGTLYFQDGKTVQYEGDFQKGLYHGFGTLQNANPVQTQEIDPNDLRDIQIQGWWTSYDGSFMRGKKTGEGRFTLTDGSTYFGLFEQDEIHGVGYLTRQNKQDLYGRWECGILKEIISG